jgi:hypothetical protein
MLPLKQFERWPGYDISGTFGVKDQIQLPTIRVWLTSVQVLVQNLTQHQSEAKAPPNGPAPMEIDPAIQRRLYKFGGVATHSLPVVRVRDIQFN